MAALCRLLSYDYDPLPCTVQFCAITGCELDMSNSQNGYKWDREEETYKRLNQACPLLTYDTQCSAEFERSWCLVLISRMAFNSCHALFIIWME